jgi:outer membrane protein OmpA-like peptidoglycan-associated protein
MRKKLKLIYVVVTVLLLTGCGAEQAMKKGDKYYALGEYFDAATQYKKAYSQTPSKERKLRGERALKMAECYRRLNYTQKAIAAYNNAIRYQQTDSLTYLRLAQQQMKDGNYKEAAKNFQTAIDVMSSWTTHDVVTQEEPAAPALSVKKNKREKAKPTKKTQVEKPQTTNGKTKLTKKEKAEKARLAKKEKAQKAKLAKKERAEKAKQAKKAKAEKAKLAKKAKAEKEKARKEKARKEKKNKKKDKKAKTNEEMEEVQTDSLQLKPDNKSDKQRELDMSQWIALAKTGLRSAQQAPQWKEEGSTYIVKRENFFNSRRADYSPMLAGEDNNQLFFTSTRNQAKGDELSGITGTKNGDIFMSQKDENGKWQRPEVIDTELNSDGDEGACSFSPDGRTMYLTQCKTDPSYPRFANIATSQRSDASWGKATDLKLTRDTLSAYAHPAVSPDGQWLYFVSNMPGGMGGYDIWRIRLTDNGVGGVENVGAPINTPGDELFPTFRPNGDLYFSSDGHEGMGGLDIYIAHGVSNEMRNEKGEMKNDDEVHSSFLTSYSAFNIEHPGYPLNSQGDDFGMTFEGLRNSGFFSSNRGDGKGWDHIFSFEKPEVIQTVKGWVYEAEGYELPEALVYMVGNDGTNLKLSVKGDGSFTQQIKPDVDYVLLGTCKGFLNHQETLRVDSVEESKEYVLQFPLASITAPVMIDNIFYDFDKATLRPESTEALDRLVVLLNENPNVAIELSAHCDYKGPAEYNKGLSQRRAEAVVAYLIEHGIEAGRLTPVGYGKEKPKTIRKKLTEKYPFLKENDVLTEEFVKTLTEEQQEQCNQLNRRTEFIVLRTTYGLANTHKQEAKQDDGQHEGVDAE